MAATVLHNIKKVETVTGDEYGYQNENQSPVNHGEADTGPVDIIKQQQRFYESFKNNIFNKYTYGYVDVLNQELLKDVIKETLTLYHNLSADELDSLTKILWEQKRFTGTEHVKILQLFVICVHDSNGELSYPPDIRSLKFTIHPIYRIPKCFKQDNRNQGRCCAIFIDEFGRVYKSWDNFKQNNKFKNCLIVAPKDGFYGATAEDKVNLDIFFHNEGFLKYVDTGSALGSMGSAVVQGVTLIPGVSLAPVVAAGAFVTGGVCGVYSGVRSIFTLVDRKKHDQSIGLENKESRAAYSNIAGGVLCAGSTVGVQMAKTAALNRQTISVAAQQTVRYVGIGSLSIQALGCVDELITIINDLRTKKPISTVYLAQFGAQLFFLAFSVKNFQLTEILLNASGSANPESIREILRQHNSDDSFKFLFAGADFLDKNIPNLANPMMSTAIFFSSCSNVVEKVKKSSEQEFESLISERVNSFVLNVIGRNEKRELRSVLLTLLRIMNISSLDVLLDFAKNIYPKLLENLPIPLRRWMLFHVHLKIVYMSIYNLNANRKLNADDFYSKKLTDEGVDLLANDVLAEMRQTGNKLAKKFDEEFKSENGSDLDLERKIYLVIQFHCKKFVMKLKNGVNAVGANVERLYDATEYVLRRLTIEAATLFFDLVKAILNEFVLQIPMHEAIKPIFRDLVKKFNGNLTAMEKELINYLSDRTKRNVLGRSLFNELTPGRALKLRNCSVCGGQGFA